MECQACGRYSPPDAETGYDADDLCPDCKDVAEAGPDDPRGPEAGLARECELALYRVLGLGRSGQSAGTTQVTVTSSGACLPVNVQRYGETPDPVAMAEQSILMALEAIRLEATTAPDVTRALEICRTLDRLSDEVCTVRRAAGDFMDTLVERRR